jgi:hypothetical protein
MEGILADEEGFRILKKNVKAFSNYLINRKSHRKG